MDDVYVVCRDKIILCVVKSETDAQEMILSLTEEYAYLKFLKNLQKEDSELVIFMFKMAKKLGWDKFYYAKQKMLN